MNLFKPSSLKVSTSVIVSSLIVFFYVPFVYQYCQPFPGQFGGGGCGPWELTSGIFPPLTNGDIPQVNITLYTLPQILLRGIPAGRIPQIKNAFYPYSLIIILVVILFAYIFSCLLVELLHKLKKKRKPDVAKGK